MATGGRRPVGTLQRVDTYSLLQATARPNWLGKGAQLSQGSCRKWAPIRAENRQSPAAPPRSPCGAHHTLLAAEYVRAKTCSRSSDWRLSNRAQDSGDCLADVRCIIHLGSAIILWLDIEAHYRRSATSRF